MGEDWGSIKARLEVEADHAAAEIRALRQRVEELEREVIRKDNGYTAIIKMERDARDQFRKRAEAAEAEVARQAALVQQYHPAHLGLPHVVRERNQAREENARLRSGAEADRLVLLGAALAAWRHSPSLPDCHACSILDAHPGSALAPEVKP